MSRHVTHHTPFGRYTAYVSGPRVAAWRPFDRYHRWDWQAGAPLPGELEYLRRIFPTL